MGLFIDISFMLISADVLSHLASVSYNSCLLLSFITYIVIIHTIQV